MDLIVAQPCPGEGLSVRLDSTIVQARSLASRWAAGSTEWLEELDAFLEAIADDVDTAVTAISKGKQDSWDEWQEKALRGGGEGYA